MDNISIKIAVGKWRLLKLLWRSLVCRQFFENEHRFRLSNCKYVSKKHQGNSLAITCSDSISIQKLNQTKNKQELNKHCNLEQTAWKFLSILSLIFKNDFFHCTKYRIVLTFMKLLRRLPLNLYPQTYAGFIARMQL